MEKRKLGQLEVSALGFGCMALSEFYGEPLDQKSAIQIIHCALESGITLLDTADMYGFGDNELLVGKAIEGRRNQVVVATKTGIVRKKEDPSFREFCGKPEYIKKQCEGSLLRLGIETIDLYYLHRLDPSTPIEESVGAMKDLVKEGKVRYIGLSEVEAEQIERAQKIHPITALETEYSLWSRDPEAEVFDLCKRLNIGFVAHSPIGRGFLGGQIKSFDQLPEDDFRRTIPRFMGENFDFNLKIVDMIDQMAKKKGCTNVQLVLAWILAHPLGIVPLFGTKESKHIPENARSTDVKLTADEFYILNQMIPPGLAKGVRYPAVSKKHYEKP